MATPPFVHGAAQWLAIGALLGGGRIVIQDDPTHLNPLGLLDVVDREGVTELMLVGDAFGVPIAEALEAVPRPLSTLRAFINGGAALSAGTRDRLLAVTPKVRIVDNMGSSESGRQATRSFGSAGAAEPHLESLKDTVVLSADRSRVLDSTEQEEIGWLARTGRIPLGYLNDAEKTRDTFVEVEGCRFAIPGDRARLKGNGAIDVLGRESTTINTGGEKVFAEEVEDALKSVPVVCDAIVFGVANDRWGSEIVAIVAVSEKVEAAELCDHASTVLARYKLPKRILFVDEVPRTVAGKPDRVRAEVLFEAERAKATS